MTLPYLFDDPLKFASIHSDPPGTPTSFPAVVLKKYGRGRVIWSAGPLEVQPVFHYKNILLNLLAYAGFEDSFLTSSAPRDVELITYDDRVENGRYLLSACRISDDDEISPVAPFEISLKTKERPESVVLLPKKTPIEFSFKDEMVTFKTAELKIFDMYEIRLKA